MLYYTATNNCMQRIIVSCTIIGHIRRFTHSIEHPYTMYLDRLFCDTDRGSVRPRGLQWWLLACIVLYYTFKDLTTRGWIL